MPSISRLEGKIKKVNPNLVHKIEIPIQILDSTKCRELTGWKPKIPIKTTLKGLLEYWDKKNFCFEFFSSRKLIKTL